MPNRYRLFAIMALLMFPTVGQPSDALIAASKAGDLAALKDELNAGADIDFEARCMAKGRGSGCTALYFAAYYGQAEVVEYLIDNGADAGSITKSGFGPLTAAIISGKGNPGIIKMLLDAGAKSNVPFGRYKMPPLIHAIWKPQPDLVDALIAHKVDLDVSDNAGDTPLNIAIFKYNEPIAEALLDAGADPTILNNKGQNIMQFSKEWEREDLATKLITKHFPDFCNQNVCD